MKNTLLILLFFLFGSSIINAQSFDLFEGDTINYADEYNNKQGHWIIFNNRTIQKLQEGYYLKGKKEGIWRSYYLTGNIKSEITYLQGEKNGYAKIYYENGNIAEEGTWMTDKWVGKYKSYYKNGKLSYLWNYNEYGHRSGYQQYFYENGNIKIEGEWKNGQEDGVIKEYYETGSIKTKRVFSEGDCDINKIKVYSLEENFTETETEKEEVENIENIDKDTIIIREKDSVEVFSGNGMHIFYNKEKKVEREGEFLDGILYNGKHYIYDNSGNLIKTIIYLNGKIEKEEK